MVLRQRYHYFTFYLIGTVYLISTNNMSFIKIRNKDMDYYFFLNERIKLQFKYYFCSVPAYPNFLLSVNSFVPTDSFISNIKDINTASKIIGELILLNYYYQFR